MKTSMITPLSFSWYCNRGIIIFNVETDLNIANSARDKIMKIILDEQEPRFSMSQSMILQLSCPPAYVLVKLLTMKMTQLQGLDQDIIPLVLLEWTFTIVQGTQTKMVNIVQLPPTAAYATFRLLLARPDN